MTANPNAYSRYMLTEVEELNIGIPVMVRDPGTGKFKMTIRLQRSTGVANTFEPFAFTEEGTVINGQGQIEFEFVPASIPSYYRLKSK